MLDLDAEKSARRDYLFDMIEQLAELAREIGEIEMAILLDATVESRRHTLENDATSRLMPLSHYPFAAKKAIR